MATEQSEELRYTLSGIPLKACYTPEDIKDIDYERDLANPGKYPFTRGLYPNGYRHFSWMKRVVSGFGLPEETNARQKFLMRQGQEAYGGLPTVNIELDVPSERGYDADNPETPEYEIGNCGVWLNSLREMEQLFEGLPLDKINTSFVTFSSSPMVLAMYIVNAENHGVPRANLRGVCTNNSLHQFPGFKHLSFPPRPTLRMMADVIKFCTEQMPYWNPVNFVGYNIREPGANAYQEVAWVFAHALETVDATLKLGFNIDDFAPRLSFFWSVENDFFEEICKMRAARRMWAKIMRERYGAKKEKSLYLRFHVDTAGRTLQPQEPLNNIARVAIQCLAAVLAGVQSVHTCSYDEPIAVPTDEAVRVAMKTQQIINHETGVTNIVDPLGGSYFIEYLTNQIEKATWDELNKVEKMGGYIACVDNHYMEREIAKNAYQYYREVEEGKRILVGVNKYVEDEESWEEKPIEINPQVAQIAKERLRKLKAERDNAAVRLALDRVREVAQDPNGHLMPIFIDAVKVCATLGEIIGVLKEVFGEYKEVPILAQV